MQVNVWARLTGSESTEQRKTAKQKRIQELSSGDSKAGEAIDYIPVNYMLVSVWLGLGFGLGLA